MLNLTPRVNFLGIDLDFPVMAASTAGIERYNNVVKEKDFCRAVVRGSKQAGTIGWRGDTWFYTPDDSPALQALEQEKGYGIPIFKPRSQDVLKRLITMAEEVGCPAVGVDLDGCGSTIMAKHGQPVFRKSVAEIREFGGIFLPALYCQGNHGPGRCRRVRRSRGKGGFRFQPRGKGS